MGDAVEFKELDLIFGWLVLLETVHRPAGHYHHGHKIMVTK